MNLFADLSRSAEQKGLRFLVIGGLAVNFYGYSRETADVDLLICRDSKSDWLRLVSEFGLKIEHDAGVFIQLEPPSDQAWPIDLMLVNAQTFEPMFASSNQVDIFGARVRIPGIEHLLALKLHALKHTRAHRFLKDFQDVEGIIRISGLDPRSEKVRQLFVKYGTLELHEKVLRACSKD